MLSLTEDDDRNLGCADIARRITDSRMRAKYVQLAMDLMEANIRHHTQLAAAQTIKATQASKALCSSHNICQLGATGRISLATHLLPGHADFDRLPERVHGGFGMVTAVV